jgi:DNA-binding response OmpR family regulator/tetratricopeptide (TPR) repeat protein
MILLIDSDERSRRLTELSLRKAGHPVSGVASLAEAGTALRSAPPTLVLTEARLSDGSALTLLAQLKAEGRNLPVIVVSDGSDASLPAAAQAAGAADVVARPLQIRELIARITGILARAASLGVATPGAELTGDVDGTTLIELLQTIAGDRQTAVLRFQHGALSGTLYFEQGELIDATGDRTQGLSVLRRMMTWETGTYRLRAAASTGRTRTLHHTMDELLNDAVDYASAWGTASAQVGDLSRTYTVDYPAFVAQLGQLPPEANTLVRLFDGIRSLEEVVALADIDDLLGCQIAGLLLRGGILVPSKDTYLGDEDGFDRMPTGQFNQVTSSAQRPAGQVGAWLNEASAASPAADPALLARQEQERIAREQEVARIATERQRAIEEQRRAHAAELQALAEEQERLELERGMHEELAQSEAELILSEAEARVKELRATAERRTNELALREQELRTRRDSITGSLSSLSGDQPAVAAPSGSSMAATISPEAAEARRREMEAMRQESTATPVAPVWFPPAAPPATSASGARQLSEESIVRASGSIPAVAETGPRELDLGAAAATQSATLSGLADHEEVFFTGAHAAIEEHHELDEMYGSNEKEPSAVRWTWIILGILVLVVIAAVLNVGNEPEPAPAPPPAPAAAQAAPAAPTAEELAKKAAAEAFDKAKIAGNDVGIAVANSATDLAEAWASSKTKELPSVAKTAPKKEISAPKSTPAPAPAIVAPVAKGSGDKCATSFAAKKYKDAVANCNAAIEADPQNSDALTYLGQAYYEMGEASSATGPLERALRINRRNTNALLTLGAARQESGNNAGAREAYERYLELNPNSRRAGEIRTILQGL